MELRDYLAALRRHWAVWVGATVVGALGGLLVFSLTPKTYEASSTVFVSVSPSIPNSASFVQQRVTSYPALVRSEAVLAPVLEDLDLDESLTDLRARVSATNPPDTTQLHVTVSGPDPAEAAEIANAVADRFADTVETLETPSSGDEPVHLTVADPAVAPDSPSSPVLLFVLSLGVLAGLFLGLAAAVVRSRTDTTLATEDGLRLAWGEDGGATEVLVQPSGRARHGALTGQVAGTLARRIELRAAQGSARVVVVAPTPGEEDTVRRFAESVTGVLRSRGLDASVGSPGTGEPTEAEGIRLDVGDPLVPLRAWKDVAERHDEVVLVVPSGRVDGRELREMRTILHSAGITPLAIALLPRPRRGGRTDAAVGGAETAVPSPPAEAAAADGAAVAPERTAGQAALSGSRRD
ncbi:YveK family protein [Blastococcus sp. SYSU D00695]